MNQDFGQDQVLVQNNILLITLFECCLSCLISTTERQCMDYKSNPNLMLPKMMLVDRD